MTRRRMTPAQHRKRHVELHRALDELLADYIAITGHVSLSGIRVQDLLKWAYAQTQNPEADPTKTGQHGHLSP